MELLHQWWRIRRVTLPASESRMLIYASLMVSSSVRYGRHYTLYYWLKRVVRTDGARARCLLRYGEGSGFSKLRSASPDSLRSNWSARPQRVMSKDPGREREQEGLRTSNLVHRLITKILIIDERCDLKGQRWRWRSRDASERCWPI